VTEELCEVPYLDLLESRQQWATQKAKSLFISYPFLNYVANFLFEHAQKAENGGISQLTMVKRFNEPGHENFKHWIYFYDLCRRADYQDAHGLRIGLIHIASEYNLLSCVPWLL
jgi:hypothetical protein